MSKSKLSMKANPTKPTTDKVVDHEQANKTSTGATPAPLDDGTTGTETTNPTNGAATQSESSTVAVDATTASALPDTPSVPEGTGSGGSDNESGGASGDSTVTGSEDGEQEGEQVLDTEPDNLGTTIYYFPNHDTGTPFSMFPPKDHKRSVCILEEMIDLGDCEVFTSVHQIKCNIKDKELEARMVDAFEQTLASRMELRQRGNNYDY